MQMFLEDRLSSGYVKKGWTTDEANVPEVLWKMLTDRILSDFLALLLR